MQLCKLDDVIERISHIRREPCHMYNLLTANHGCEVLKYRK